MPRILLVEDDFLVRLTLMEALADDGFDVLEASNADEALATLTDQADIALLITDVQMPGSMDGVQLVTLMRARLPELPVIFMTGRPDSIGARAASSRETCITKPYLPSQICAAARRLIAG